MAHFYDKGWGKIKNIEKEFLKRARDKPFGPIGDPSEQWYWIQNEGQRPLSFCEYLLIFSDSELANKFIAEIGCFDDKTIAIQKMSWGEILEWSFGEGFYGVVVDLLVREDFSFHSID